MSDQIVLQLGNDDYTGWKSITVQRSMENLCGSFDITLVDKKGTATDNIVQGLPCKIYIKEDLFGANIPIMNGYIDGIKLKEAPNSTEMSIQGRDITCDLVDSAAILPSSTIVRAKFSKIINDIVEPFGINVDTSELTSDEVIDKFTLQNGDTAYEAIERLCRSQAVLPLTNTEGDLLLTYSADVTTLADSDLTMGDNVKTMDKSSNWKDRFSEYTIRGQRSGKGKAWDGNITQMIRTASDLEINRYRPHVFMSENKGTDNNLQSRVNWEAQVRAGRGTFYNVVVEGWFQRDRFTGLKTSNPWTFNLRTNLRNDKWGVNEQQLITAVNYTKDDSGGSITRLVLKHPDSYKANPTAEVALS